MKRVPNPFQVLDEPIGGHAKDEDIRPFRFLPPHLASLSAVEGWAEEALPGVLHAYGMQARDGDWSPIPYWNWRLGVYVEGLSDRGLPPFDSSLTAIAVALGVHPYALRRHQAYLAASIQAHAETIGPRLAAGDIAAEAGIDMATLYRLRRLKEYRAAVARFKRLASGSIPARWGTAVPYIAESWLNPVWQMNWQVEADYVAQEIISRIKAETRRLPPAALRRAMYTMVEWHAHRGHPLSPTAIKAMAYALGQVNHKSGQLLVRRGEHRRQETLIELAAWVGQEVGLGRGHPSIAALCRRGDVARSDVKRWLDDTLFQQLAEAVAAKLRDKTEV